MIIGIVGGNNEAASIQELAKQTGQRFAAHGDVVLTGGHLEGKERQVKVKALEGAAEAGTSESPRRILGILRKTYSSVPKFVAHPDGIWRAAYLHATLKNGQHLGDGRNLLNGLVSDAVVALPGGPGTASEVYFALAGGRPVVLLRWTTDELAAKTESDDFDDYLELGEAGIHLIERPDDVDDYITTNRNLYTSADIDDAVDYLEDRELAGDEGRTALKALTGSPWDDLTEPLKATLRFLCVEHDAS